MDSPRKSGSTKDSTMITLFVFLVLLQGAFAAQFTVGGSSGWRIPASGAPSYDSEFTNQALAVGDTLRFPYAAGQHNVYVVSQSDLQSCSAANPIQVHTEANAVITLNSTGNWSFICEVPGHCSAGMHLQVTVGGASTPTPAPVSTPVPAPVRAPVPAPVRPPTPAPLRAPTLAPAPSTVPQAASPSEGPGASSGPGSSGAAAMSVPFALLSAAAFVAVLVL